MGASSSTQMPKPYRVEWDDPNADGFVVISGLPDSYGASRQLIGDPHHSSTKGRVSPQGNRQ
jgi:hypothetical protein